jgi:hypothetical protein
MTKEKEGRLAGHHITPGLGWRWQQFGPSMMLVTDGGGADVVLSGGRDGLKLTTCGPDGVMIKFQPDSPLGMAIAAIPTLVDALRDLLEYNDRPRQLKLIREALAAAGLASQ